ncbi:MAG TPA: hypothetical protein VEZ90_00970 [Blastocatellia bacterium]|nr:hypothetical protein [Blastocatellia bacterium]
MRIKSLLISALLLSSITRGFGFQKPDGRRNSDSGTTLSAATSASENNAIDVARAALASEGGDKFRNLKSLYLLGSVELYSGSKSTGFTSGQFAIVQAGDRARTDIETPDVSYREIYDGKRSYSTLNPASVAPPAKFGLSVLGHYDQAGYTITGLPDERKLHGFRITDQDGNFTDFYADPTTGRVMEFSFTYNNIKFSTEFKSFKEVDGVLVPISFMKKYQLPRVDIYLELKVKDVKINQPVGDDVFTIPKR